MVLKEWVNEWLDVYKRRGLKHSTYEGYKHYAKHLDCIGDKQLADINVFDCQRVVNKMADEGLSISAIKHTITILRQSLKKAVQVGARFDNPALCVDLPRNERAKITALNDIEVAQMRVHRVDSFYYDVFDFMLESGLRAGEVIALTLDDINFADGYINVRHSAYRGEITTPKTSDGVRIIPLTAETLRILRRVSRGHRSGFVFRNTNGGPINYNCLLKAWHRLQDKCGYNTRYGLHVFRHTFATRLLRAGVDVKTISTLLGHSDIKVTLDTYCDCDIGLLRNAIATMRQKYSRI